MKLNNYEAALISETHLKPHDKFTLANFKIYRTDKTNRLGGCMALMIHKHVAHTSTCGTSKLIEAYNPPG